MIDSGSGLEVRVRTFVGKKTIPEAKISDQSPLYISDKRHRMIPATNNERFEVQVVVTNKFDFKGYRYVRARVDFDGGVRTISKYVFNNSIRSRGPNAGSFKHTFTNLKGRRNGQWMYLGFAFGALEIDKDLVLDAEQESKQAAAFGTIKVTFQRGWTLRTDADVGAYTTPQTVPSLKTSRKVVVEHQKTHGFKYE